MVTTASIARDRPSGPGWLSSGPGSASVKVTEQSECLISSARPATLTALSKSMNLGLVDVEPVGVSITIVANKPLGNPST